jgi:hypothetical protein
LLGGTAVIFGHSDPHIRETALVTCRTRQPIVSLQVVRSTF